MKKTVNSKKQKTIKTKKTKKEEVKPSKITITFKNDNQCDVEMQNVNGNKLETAAYAIKKAMLQCALNHLANLGKK